jgi:hypothetical protein
MNVRLVGRAHVSLRSLEPKEKRQISVSLQHLSSTDYKTLLKSGQLHRLVIGFSQRQLFVYAVGANLRLILSLSGNTWRVEDIVSHDWLERIRRIQSR